MAIAAVPVLLIVAQPDLGTVLIISAAVVAMIGASGAPARWVIGLLLAAIVGHKLGMKPWLIPDQF